MSAVGIQVDSQSIDEAMRDAEFGEFWIQFRSDNCSLVDMSRALDTADDRAGGITVGEGGWRIPTGIVVYVDPGTSDDLQDWMTRLVASLEVSGATGTLEGIKPAEFDGYLIPTEDPTPAAFLAWAEDPDSVAGDEYRTSHWHVPADATNAIVEHAAAWTEQGGEQSIVVFRRFPLDVSPDADVSSLLNSALLDNHAAESIRYNRDQQRARTATLRPGGAATMQEIGAQPSRQRLDAVRHALTTSPIQYLDLAFIRPAPRYAGSWTQINMRQKLPDLDESDIRYNRHLLSRYTPDAHGLQILTDQHLARARDLSSWNIDEIGPDRHLVETQDLAAWYSTRLPDQEVVDQARHDFGDMILTKDIISANPPPWNKSAV